MSTHKDTVSGWACVDCLMILANGEDNPEWSEDEAHEHHARMDARREGSEVTLGLLRSEHDADCDTDETGGDDYCEQREFSWSSCDTCGSTLGGSRHAVTFWAVQ